MFLKKIFQTSLPVRARPSRIAFSAPPRTRSPNLKTRWAIAALLRTPERNRSTSAFPELRKILSPITKIVPNLLQVLLRRRKTRLRATRSPATDSTTKTTAMVKWWKWKCDLENVTCLTKLQLHLLASGLWIIAAACTPVAVFWTKFYLSS